MNSSIALRLMWKEYRAQRGLWLSIMAGVLLLQMLVPWTGPPATELSGVLTSIAWILVYCFAVAASGSTFAGQREDGTHLRSVLLAGPPSLTLLVPLAAQLLGCLLILGLGLLSAGLIAGLSQTLTFLSQFPSGLAGLLLFALPLCLLSGAACSLLLPGALSAVTLTAAVCLSWGLLIPGSVAVQRMNNEFDVSTVLLIWATLFCVLLVVDALLIQRWLNRSFSSEDTPLPGRVRQSLRLISARNRSANSYADPLAEPDFVVHPVETAILLPPPARALGKLHWLRCGPRLRELKFLMWRERRESLTSFLWLLTPLLVLTFLGATAAVTGSHRHPGNGAATPLFMMSLILSAGCGFLSFRSEHAREQWRWNSNHGISPRRIWGSKHMVWLMRLGLGCLTLLTVALAGARLNFNDLMNGLLQADASIFHGVMPGTELSRAGRMLLIVLTMFAIGQMCSALIPRTVIALFATSMGFATAMMLLTFSYWLGLPPSILLLPLIVTMFVVTWVWMPAWQLDLQKLKRWRHPAVTAATGLLLTSILIVAWRVYEIPSATPVITDPQTIAALSALPTTEEQETLRLYQQALDDLKIVQQPSTEGGTKALSLLRQAASRPACVSRPITPEWYSTPEPLLHQDGSLVRVLLDEARHEEQAGKPAAALEMYREALTVVRHVHGRGSLVGFVSGTSLQRPVFQALTRWAATDGVTPDLIQQARQMIREHQTKLPPLEHVLWREHRGFEATLKAPREIVQRLFENDPAAGYWLVRIMRLPGELERCRRLSHWEEALEARLLAEFRAETSKNAAAPWLAWKNSLNVQLLPREVVSGNSPWNNRMLSPLERDLVRTQQWIQTTALRRVFHSPVLMALSTSVETEADRRACLTALDLIEQWHLTGQLPKELPVVEHSVDPWNARHFAWFPRGLQKEQIDSERIPVGVPFLVISGPGDAVLMEETLEPAPDFEGGMGAPGMAPEPEPRPVPESLIPVRYQAEGAEPTPLIRHVYRIRARSGTSSVLLPEPRFWTLPAGTLQSPGAVDAVRPPEATTPDQNCGDGPEA